jgi:hypothetical protein
MYCNLHNFSAVSKFNILYSWYNKQHLHCKSKVTKQTTWREETSCTLPSTWGVCF